MMRTGNEASEIKIGEENEDEDDGNDLWRKEKSKNKMLSQSINHSFDRMMQIMSEESKDEPK